MKWITHLGLFFIFIAFSNSSISSSVDDQKVNNEFNTLTSLFFDAARIGNNEVIKKFIDSGFPIDLRNHQSYTVLMVAAYQGQRETVQLLLDEGANACIKDKRGNTALLGALIKREILIAKDLYQADCPYQSSRNKSGLNLDEFAKLFGQTKVLEQLKKEYGNN